MRALIALIALAPAAAYAAGDASAGQAIFTAKCHMCHSNKPGENKIGPSLAGVVGRPSASVPGFNYSPAMQSAHKTWTEAELNTYLTNPKGVVPGTKMTFAGLPSETDRANVIAYLATLK